MRTKLKAPVSRTFTALPTSWLWPAGPPIWQISTLGAAVALTSVAVPALPTVLPDKPAPAHTQAAPVTDDSGRIEGTVSGGNGSAGSPGTDPASVPTVTAVTPSQTSGATPSQDPRATPTATPTAGPAATGVPTPTATDGTPATTPPLIDDPATDPATQPVTLAASDPGNQRFLASSTGCPTCASGSRVIGIGLLATLTVPVEVDTAGSRQLTIAYETLRERDLYVSVNGGSSQKITVAGTGGWETPGWTSVTVELKPGKNQIKFHNPLGLAPDLDQITLS
ncbi:hypothetical protein [Kineosporia sp. NBRC 101731]|uniref:hypothetical protein n=1 Tax=Kineosporia sp. NBRC 101731 TaxID=3032199 RepID=UPI0024A12A98|nr:hypothetical protein [Kineosporia sp. NBRC 101731]GLY31934.1 hypothetical protein Kisp02_52990 [Kineosporia sp. NBRC 101731]